MTWRPHRPNPCRLVGCEPQWEPLTVNGHPGQIRICARPRCRHVTSVVIDLPHSSLAALQNTSGMPSTDFDGCTD